MSMLGKASALRETTLLGTSDFKQTDTMQVQPPRSGHFSAISLNQESERRLNDGSQGCLCPDPQNLSPPPYTAKGALQ